MTRLRDALDSFIFHIILRNPREADDCCDKCEFNGDCICCSGCLNLLPPPPELDGLHYEE